MTRAQTEARRIVHEDALAPAVARALAAQGAAIARAIAGAGSLEEARAQADLIAWDTDIATAILSRIVEHTAPEFADRAYADLSPKRAPIDWMQVVRAWILSRGALLVVGITEATREMVRAVIARGVEEGLGVEAIARQLGADWPDLARSRAHRIVRTEVVRASNLGSLLGAREASLAFGIPVEKEWIATMDDRTRDTHADLDGVKVPMDGLFDVGGFPAQYPGDPSLPGEESINCRCTVAFVPIEEVPTRSKRPEVTERREAVRLAYPSLRRKHGREVACDMLGAEYGVGARTILRDIYPSRR